MQIRIEPESSPRTGSFTIRSFLFLVSLLVQFSFLPTNLFCQKSHQAKPIDCCRAPLFYLDNLPPPQLISGIGDNSLKITTKSPKAQQYFNQGLNLLHCFWDFEAYRAFKEAARLDNNCAMAYWGMHVALPENKIYREQKEQLIEKAKALKSNISEQEQFYIEAYQQLFTTEDEDEADQAFQTEMEALIDRYPEDKDAKLFLALKLMAGYQDDGRPKEGTVYAQMLLANLLQKYPDCAAAHHYWIHAMEEGHPQAALESADRLTKLAPNSGHMVHMPGHIYYRMGDYEKAQQAFQTSRQVDTAYMKDQQVMPVNVWNYIHNLDYLVANCAESGRYREGLKYAEELQNLELKDEQRKMPNSGLIPYTGKLTRARLHLRFKNWAAAATELAQLCSAGKLPTTYIATYYKGLLAYTEGMAALEKEELARANENAQTLEALLWRMSNQLDKPSGPADEPFSTSIDILEVSALELRGCLESHAGHHEEAIKILQKAGKKEQDLGYREPPIYTRSVLESLAEAYLRARQWNEARKSYEAVLKKRPNSGHALYGIARSFAAADQQPEAVAAYNRFLQNWRNADEDLPQMREAKTWLGEFNHEAHKVDKEKN